MRTGATVEDICRLIHKYFASLSLHSMVDALMLTFIETDRDLVDQFKYALVWGASAKHTPQRVGLKHKLQDEDVIYISKK